MNQVIQKESQFHSAVKDRFGIYTGKAIADRAVKELRSLGIDPEELKPVTSGTSKNVMIYSVDNLAVKLMTNVEGYNETVDDKVKLKPLAAAYVGFDMGNAPITLVVTPLMSTKAVTERHVKALCHELDKSGKLFRDNKPDNVALTRDGLPYVIDDGAVTLRSQLNPLERMQPYHYPANSGQDLKTGTWDAEASSHKFRWPENQMDIPEFREAAANLVERRRKAAELSPLKG